MWGRRIVGLLFLVVGVIWILQGVDVLGGSGMSGHGEWAFFGTMLVIGGLALLATSIRFGHRDGELSDKP